MKKLVVIVVAAVAAACVVAQDKPNRGPNGRGGPGGDRPHAGERPHPGMGPNAGMWVPRMFSSKAVLERIGVTDEAQRTKIQEGLRQQMEQGEEIERQIREISRQQAEAMQALLKDKSADPKAVMEKIGEVAKLRAKQARLSVKAILVLRDNLTPEQLEKVSSMLNERGRARGAFRRGGDDRGGEHPGRGARGDRPRGDRPRGERRGPAREGQREKRSAPKES